MKPATFGGRGSAPRDRQVVSSPRSRGFPGDVLRWERRVARLREDLASEQALRGLDADQHVAVPVRRVLLEIAAEQFALRRIARAA